MKIDENTMIIKELRFDNGRECIEIMDGEDVRITVPFRQGTKIFEGQFEFIDDKYCMVDGSKICTKNICEIDILK